MPFLIERFDLMSKSPQFAQKLPGGFREEARHFYYDTAQSSNAIAMTALKALIPVPKIVFGTDFPFRTALDHVTGLQESRVFAPEELRQIERNNAVGLLPRLGAA